MSGPNGGRQRVPALSAQTSQLQAMAEQNKQTKQVKRDFAREVG
jgi:hypothetical protein